MANKVIKGFGFHHIALRALDFEKSCAFYQEALGCEIVAAWGEAPARVVMLDLGDDGRIELFEEHVGEKPENVAGAGEWYHLALRTDEPDLAYERALSAGAKSKMVPTDLVLDGTPVRIAFVYGLSGEVIEFFQTK